MRAVLLVLFFALAVLSQNVDRIKIDDYEEGFNECTFVLSATPPSSGFVGCTSIFTSTSGAKDTKILGGERDLIFVALTGSSGRVFSSSVSVVNTTGQWDVSSPNGASGEVTMQYDSLDNSTTLQVNGFTQITGTSSGLDLTEGGLGEAFRMIVETDIATVYTISVYSPDGSHCDHDINVPSGNVPQDVLLQFSQFTGSCDFKNVGAIVVVIQAFANVDTIVTLFETVGTPPSPTPSPSIGASVSPSPSAAPAAECYCTCPAFTCELIFDLDDDQNNAYFFVDDDGFGRSRGYFGGYGYYYANGVGRQSNDSNGLYISILAVVSALFALF